MRVGLPLFVAALAACGREDPSPVPPRPEPAATPSSPAVAAPKLDPLKRGLEDLKSSDPELRLAAMAGLESLGPDAAPALPALLAALEDPEERLRSAGAKAIAAIGKAAISPVTELLAHARSGIRWRAASILRELGPRATEAVPRLLEVLEARAEEADDLVAREVLAALRSMGRPAVSQAVDALSRGTRGELRAAIHFLGSLETADPEAIAGLLRAERHLDTKLRGWAVRSRRGLQSLARPVEETRALLKSADSTIWMAAVEDLSYGPVRKELLPELLDLLKRKWSPGPDESNDLHNAIARIGSEAFDSLSDLLNTEDRVLASNLPTLIYRVQAPPARVVARMIEVLGGTSSAGRRAALLVLANMGPSATAAIPDVERLIKAGDTNLKTTAVHYYWATGSPEGARAFAGLLKDPAIEVRQQALMTLDAMGALTIHVESEVNELLKDPRLSRQAESVMKKIREAKETPPPPPAQKPSRPTSDAVRAAIDRLRGPNSGIRCAAAAELGLARAEAPQVVPALLEALYAEDPEVRRASALGLVSLGASAIPQITECIFRAPEAPMVRSVLGLMGPGAAEAVPALLKAQLRSSRGRAYLRVIRNIGPAAVPALKRELKGSDAYMAIAAAQALGEIGPAAFDALPALEEAAAAVPPTKLQREARIAALRVRAHSLSPAEIARQLSPGLSHPDRATRGEALETVFLIGPKAEGVLPALLDLLKTDSTDASPSSRGTIPGIGRAAFLALVKALDTQDRGLAAAARGVLKGMEAPREAVPELAKLLKHPSDSTRANALAVLEEMAPLAHALSEEIQLLLRAENPKVRIGAVRFLAAHAPDHAVASLGPLLKDPIADVKLQTAQALVRMHGRGVSMAPASAALQEALKDDAIRSIVGLIPPE